jgi:hypothetical protein
LTGDKGIVFGAHGFGRGHISKDSLPQQEVVLIFGKM